MFKLREAIDNINNGTLTANQPINRLQVVLSPESEKPSLQPLLGDSNTAEQNLSSSMDSALSNSDNCSDIEMSNIDEQLMGINKI